MRGRADQALSPGQGPLSGPGLQEASRAWGPGPGQGGRIRTRGRPRAPKATLVDGKLAPGEWTAGAGPTTPLNASCSNAKRRSDTSASGKTHAAGNAMWLIWQRPKRTRYRPTRDPRGRQIARRYRQSLGGTSLTTATFSGMKVPVVRRSAIGVARLCLAAHAFG